ncbi:MAG: wrbA2 [Clostridia bacterium]|jgi:multimeric flavodoxin WrbA|nr:wrbA2 [Clostridia bacterium]
MIKIAAIHGSPRKNHNSDRMLEAVLEGMKVEQHQVRHIYTADEDIRPCRGCNACAKKTGCVIQDDMQEAYKILDDADIVITTTPVYFHSVTAQLKTFIDRTQAVWAAKYVIDSSVISRKRRLGFAICTGGPPQEKSYFDCTLKVLDIFHKCINAKLTGTITVADVDRIQVENREDVIEHARLEGKKLIELYENN